MAGRRGLYPSAAGKLGCVLEAERHAKELKKTERGDDSRLGNVDRMYGHLVVSTDEVHLAEDLAAMQLRPDVLDVRHWVLVGCRDVI